MNNDNILEMREVCKYFPGVRALEDVDFSVRRGEIHALMGENGAGKSTLIKVLTGVYQKDKGTVLFDGKETHFANTLDAQKSGISTVYQELNMIPYLSVAENIYLGRYPKDKLGIDWKKLYSDAQSLLEDMGLSLDVHRPLNDYGTASQQMVSIARAVSLNCQLMVMDEPTSSLDTKEVQKLFSIIESLKKRGISVIFISHRLDEVYHISDRITILKDGSYVGTYKPDELDQYELINKMVGRSVKQNAKSLRNFHPQSGDYLVELDDIACFPKVLNVSIRIQVGEIVGLAGLLGSGRTETAQVLFGYERPETGDIRIHGKTVNLRAPKDALRYGLAFCTENRREEGVIPNMSVRDNIAISCLPKLSRYGMIDKRKRDQVVDEYIEKFRIKTPHTLQKLKNLSGGNQQKVILARWLATNPQLIILDEPTRGIDVGAKKEVETLIAEFADQGIGVLFISSEIGEMARNCDRIYVMRDGEIIGNLTGDDIDEDTIMRIIANRKCSKEG